MPVPFVHLRDKNYYLNTYHKCISYCQRVTEARQEEDSFVLFNEICNAEEIVGLYLDCYGEEAYDTWLDNAEGCELNKTQQEVQSILMDLFTK